MQQLIVPGALYNHVTVFWLLPQCSRASDNSDCSTVPHVHVLWLPD